MAKVEPFGYPIDEALKKKIDLMIKRCVTSNPKRDAVLICEGEEGQGKTTMSVGIAYYVKSQTGREFNHNNVFFDLEEMIKVLQTTENQIAIWDEPALQALSRDAMTGIVKNLERLLMMARKKRHFIIINLAYFNKFSEYIVWQRPLGMIHVFSRNEIEPGRWVYIKKKNLERLWHLWRTKHMRAYKKFTTLRGSFPDVMSAEYKHNVLSDFDINFYEHKKDEAIRMIGNPKNEKADNKQEIKNFKYIVGNLEVPIRTKKELALKLGIKEATLYDWAKLEYKELKKKEKVKFSLENSTLDAREFTNKGNDGDENNLAKLEDSEQNQKDLSNAKRFEHNLNEPFDEEEEDESTP